MRDHIALEFTKKAKYGAEWPPLFQTTEKLRVCVDGVLEQGEYGKGRDINHDTCLLKRSNS